MQGGEHRQPGIFPGQPALAGREVEVRPALRAQPFALFVTQRLARQSQQGLLLHERRHINLIPAIEAGRQFFTVQPELTAESPLRSEHQRELTGKRERIFVEAARALAGQRAVYGTGEEQVFSRAHVSDADLQRSSQAVFTIPILTQQPVQFLNFLSEMDFGRGGFDVFYWNPHRPVLSKRGGMIV